MFFILFFLFFIHLFICSFFHFYVSVIADSFIFWVVSLTHNCHNFLRSRFFTCYICFFIFQQNWPHCYWYCYFNLLSFSQTTPDLKLIGCSMIIFQFVGNKAKGWILKRVFKKQSSQISRKMNNSYPLIRTRTCAYQGVRKVRFSEYLACFVSLKYLFWDSPFFLITDEFS